MPAATCSVLQPASHLVLHKSGHGPCSGLFLRLCALEIIVIIIMIIYTASSDMQCATTYLST